MNPPSSPLKIAATAVLILVVGIGKDGLSQQASPPPVQTGEEQATAALKEAQQKLQQLGPSQYALGDIKIDAAARTVRLPCVVLHQQIPIEYVLVHETGKDHETILITHVSPTDFQVAMLLAHFSPGTTGLFDKLPKGEPLPFSETPPSREGAHQVRITAEWKDAEGKEQSRPLHEWYQNSDTREAPDIDFWIFNGSKITDMGFAAEGEGSFISVYADANALFNSPATGNHRDDLWISQPKAVPAEGTAVTLVFSPFKEEASKPQPRQ